VHVSAIGVDDPRDSLYLQSKSWGERLALDAWSQTTVLRPSVIFGKEDRFINTFARLQRFAPFVPLACSQARFQPVWVEDVGHAIATTLERPEDAGRTFECVGPNELTLRDLVRRAGRWAGVPRPIVPLPLPLARLQAWLMEKLPGEPLMSRDNLRSMQAPNVATPGALSLADLGIVPRSLDDYLMAP
jgi:NADH dehydrogenase